MRDLQVIVEALKSVTLVVLRGKKYISLLIIVVIAVSLQTLMILIPPIVDNQINLLTKNYFERTDFYDLSPYNYSNENCYRLEIASAEAYYNNNSVSSFIIVPDQDFVRDFIGVKRIGCGNRSNVSVSVGDVFAEALGVGKGSFVNIICGERSISAEITNIHRIDGVFRNSIIVLCGDSFPNGTILYMCRSRHNPASNIISSLSIELKQDLFRIYLIFTLSTLPIIIYSATRFIRELENEFIILRGQGLSLRSIRVLVVLALSIILFVSMILGVSIGVLVLDISIKIASLLNIILIRPSIDLYYLISLFLYSYLSSLLLSVIFSLREIRNVY